MLPEFEQLNTLRLRRDFTWAQLADYMWKKGRIRIAPRTLHWVLTSKNAKPRDRTVFKIQEFVRENNIGKPTARKPKRQAPAAEARL